MALLLTLDGALSELPRLVEGIASLQLPEEPEFQLNLALEELFTNAIEHGGCTGMRGAVEIRMEPAGGGVRVEYRDRGTPFNPLAAPEPSLDAPLAERAAGGLGVHFVRQVMRNLQYDRSGEWNRLTMELPLPERDEKG